MVKRAHLKVTRCRLHHRACWLSAWLGRREGSRLAGCAKDGRPSADVTAAVHLVATDLEGLAVRRGLQFVRPADSLGRARLHSGSGTNPSPSMNVGSHDAVLHPLFPLFPLFGRTSRDFGGLGLISWAALKLDRLRNSTNSADRSNSQSTYTSARR